MSRVLVVPTLATASGLVLLLGASGCGRSAELAGRIDGMRQVLEQADAHGARACAPRELAMARAHLDFADTELAQGDAARAAEHLSVAEPNARAALRLSPAERCLARTEPPPPVCVDPDHDGICGDDDRCADQAEDVDGVEDLDGCPEDQDTDGDGISDGRDMCLAEAEDTDSYLDQDGCPDPDNDLDGVMDAGDHCAGVPEDPDGFEDADGCPDPDNDADAILDVNDRCPNEPGIEAEQGCPRVYQDVQVTGSAIRIHQQIFFEFNRAVIRSESFGILNTVAQVMRDYPAFTIEVQGHTDDRGDDNYNMRLSQERADSVRTYLVGQGVDAARLTAHGYGETRPIESNRTSQGRAQNRRVEFIRTDTGATSR